MKINITRDEKGRISSIDVRSENQDGHLSKEEYELVKKVIEEDSNEEKKRVEEFHKASVGKHKEWASVSATIITGFCEAVVDYLEEKEIRDATKPKEPKFDKSVDHLDLTGPKDEESNEATVDDYKRCINDLLLDHMNIGQSKNSNQTEIL